MFPLYRNKSIVLICKLIEWFLYDGNTGDQWVDIITSNIMKLVIFRTVYHLISGKWQMVFFCQ